MNALSPTPVITPGLGPGADIAWASMPNGPTLWLILLCLVLAVLLLAVLVIGGRLLTQVWEERNEIYRESLAAAQARTDGIHETARALERLGDLLTAQGTGLASLTTICTTGAAEVSAILVEIRKLSAVRRQEA